jgi:aminoglycoside phosphotransferase (APT) family kinase protein
MHEKKIRHIVRTKFNTVSKIKIKRLGMGENNLNYLVIVDDKKYVFRINMKNHLEKNLIREFNVMKLVPHNIGLTPLILDTTKRYIPRTYSMFEYVDGKSTFDWDKRKLKIHAQTMAKLHSKTYSYWQTTKVKHKKFSLYKQLLHNLKGYKKFNFNPALKNLIREFKQYIKNNDHYFLELKRFHFIHGDLCNDNILFNRKSIHYIDWEWCGIKDNAEDLARLYFTKNMTPWYVGLSKKQVKYFIDEYLKIIKDPTLQIRVEIWNNYDLFVDMMYYFWKVENYYKFKSKLPKKHYIEASKQLLHYFSIKFKYLSHSL